MKSPMVMVAPAPPREFHLALIATASKQPAERPHGAGSERRGSELEKALKGCLHISFLMRDGAHREPPSQERYRKLAPERARRPCFCQWAVQEVSGD